MGGGKYEEFWMRRIFGPMLSVVWSSSRRSSMRRRSLLVVKDFLVSCLAWFMDSSIYCRMIEVVLDTVSWMMLVGSLGGVNLWLTS